MALNEQAFADQSWLTMSPLSGTIAAGGRVSVTATRNSAASALPRAIHSATVTFSNLTSTIAHERASDLTVQGPATLPFTEDFETGTLDSFWTTEGTGENRIRITTEETPHGGSYHALLEQVSSIARIRLWLNRAADTALPTTRQIASPHISD